MIYSVLTLYVLWVGTTYLLERLPRSLLRPDAQGLRLAYAILANVMVGTLGSMVLLCLAVRGRCLIPGSVGFGTPRRALVGIPVGLVTGGALYLAQGAPSVYPIVVLNGFAQVLPVSVAEVLICWALVGVVCSVPRDAGAHRIVSGLVAAVVASVLFGIYHIAHSPPFNTPGMIALLTVVGLATSAFFFSVRDVYGTIVFHNFLATFGVLRAMAAADALGQYATPKLALLGTAIIPLGLIIVMHVRLLRVHNNQARGTPHPAVRPG